MPPNSLPSQGLHTDNLEKYHFMKVQTVSSSKIKKIEKIHKDAPGWNKCGKHKTKSVTGTALGYVHEITEAVTCETLNFVYYWKYVIANCQDYPDCEYIGMTS